MAARYGKGSVYIIGIVAALLVVAGLSSLAAPSRADGVQVTQSSLGDQIAVDGTIESGEWEDADWYNMPFYLDMNESEGNVDGYNYYSVGEDDNNLYIALDLCGDRTGNEEGEWVSAWLNTAYKRFGNETEGSRIEWRSFLDDGTENFVYSIDEDSVFPFFSDEISEESAEMGGAEILGERDLERLVPFSSDMRASFSDPLRLPFADRYIEEIRDIELEISLNGNQTSADFETAQLAFANSSGDFDYSDSERTYNLTFSTVETVNRVPYNMDYALPNDTIRFEVRLYDESDFEVNVSQMEFFFNITQDNGALRESSLNGAESTVRHSFGESANCEEDHRMIEMRIKKEGLEHYDSDEDLGVYFGGQDETGPIWWCGSPLSGEFNPFFSGNYIYLDMMGEDPEEELDPLEELIGISMDDIILILAIIAAISISLITIVSIVVGAKIRAARGEKTDIGIMLGAEGGRKEKICPCDPGDPQCECSI